MTTISHYPIAACIALSCCVGASQAATFCVDSTNGMSNALASAAANGADDSIRIVTGTLSAPVGGFSFTAGANDLNRNLEISGGWNASCTVSTPNSTLSQISGGDLRPILRINRGAGNTGELSIRRLQFRNAFSNAAFADGLRGLALRIEANQHAGSTLIEHNIFNSNNAVADLGTVFILHRGTLTFRNNLVYGNSSGIGSPGVTINSLLNSTAYVVGNTVTGNSVFGMPGPGMGLVIDTSSNALAILSNNIVWGNNFGAAANDLKVDEGATLIANNYGSLAAPAGLIMSGNSQFNPQFMGAGNYRLAVNSPVRDQGVSAPLGGQASGDLDAALRVQGTAVDLGAYEAAPIWLDDEIFASGLE